MVVDLDYSQKSGVRDRAAGFSDPAILIVHAVELTFGASSLEYTLPRRWANLLCLFLRTYTATHGLSFCLEKTKAFKLYTDLDPGSCPSEILCFYLHLYKRFSSIKGDKSSFPYPKILLRNTHHTILTPSLSQLPIQFPTRIPVPRCIFQLSSPLPSRPFLFTLPPCLHQHQRRMGHTRSAPTVL
jgi:hypothetical protein